MVPLFLTIDEVVELLGISHRKYRKKHKDAPLTRGLQLEVCDYRDTATPTPSRISTAKRYNITVLELNRLMYGSLIPQPPQHPEPPQYTRDEDIVCDFFHNGLSQQDIAAIHSLSQPMVSNIIRAYECQQYKTI